MPHWDFGCPTGWEEQPQDVILRTAVEQNYDKTRPTATRQVIQVKAQWAPLRNYDRGNGYLRIFTFWKVDCRLGALQFSMFHPWVGDPRMYLFKSTPVFGSMENKWITVTADLVEMLPWVPNA